MIGSLLSVNAGRFPDRTALVFDEKRFSYTELNARACRLGNALTALGVGKGERVATLLHNSNQFIEAFFGLAKIGAVFVPINFRLAAGEIQQILESCTPAVLIFGDELGDVLEPIEAAALLPRHLVRVGAPSTGSGAVGNAMDYESMIQNASSREPEEDVSSNDDQLLLHTSGTTGHPKGALWAHRTTLCSSMAKIIDFELSPSDITVVFGPLFHVGPLMDLAIPVLLRGGRLVIGRSRGFDPVKVLATMEKERVTVVTIYPTMWRRVLGVSKLEQYDLRSLRLLFTGGEPIPKPILREIYARFPHAAFINTYGSTEAGPISTFLAPEHQQEKIGSIGKPAFTAEIKIVDEHDRELSADEVGELTIRSSFVFNGYWNRPHDSAAPSRNGWWHTGDLGWKDAEGFIWIGGRKKDMIISGTENIYPIEVEQVIATLDGVMEVAVVGVPDEQWGESVAAFIVREKGANLDEAEIIDHCQAKIASYKKPRHVLFVDSLPRTTVNKISKDILRRQFTPPLSDAD
ncbi:MAG: long-chain fatty acid--CoA ligase [Gammaproteobacteria bacterium]|nr:long-chain fatty acid--CoA ligase [Gammaproteobacteria bacterium]